MPRCRSAPVNCGVNAIWKVNMYGALNMERGKRKANAMMRLRRKNSDASMLLPGWKAFSGVAALFIAVANLQVSQFAGVDNASNSQGHILRTSTCALTSGSSGPANSPLRYAFAVH